MVILSVSINGRGGRLECTGKLGAPSHAVRSPAGLMMSPLHVPNYTGLVVGVVNSPLWRPVGTARAGADRAGGLLALASWAGCRVLPRA